MTHRLLAVLGSIAFGIRSFIGSILSLVGLRWLARFAVPAIVALMALAAVLSARDTAAILGSRPQVQPKTLSEVAAIGEDAPGSIWFAFDALLDQRHFSIPADLGTFFYLARDPADPSSGLLVRSPLNDAFFRQRVISARITEDDALVSSAVDSLGTLPEGFDLDHARYLDELGSGGLAEEAFLPGDLAEEAAGAELLVAGRIISPETFAACANESGCDGADASWLYYFADPQGGSVVVLRSPHPPEALPARLEGLYQRDTFDLAPVLASDWFAGLDAQVPTERAFFAQRRPPIMVQASWVPTIIFAVVGIVLLASYLVGYPVFGARTPTAPARRLASGDGIDVQITGRLDREGGPIVLDRSPGALERISIPELALRMWRYGVLPRDLSRREAEERFVAEAAGETDRLVLHERDQSALVTILRDSDAARVEVGRLYRLAGGRPAIHLRQGKTDTYLTTRSDDERDRAAAEVLGEATALG